MPSAHSAFVVGLTTAVGIREGTGSSLFAVALVLTLIVHSSWCIGTIYKAPIMSCAVRTQLACKGIRSSGSKNPD
eukprot:scaffold40257_cov15-Tisochrysis_lutea.AAC.1